MYIIIAVCLAILCFLVNAFMQVKKANEIKKRDGILIFSENNELKISGFNSAVYPRENIQKVVFRAHTSNSRPNGKKWYVGSMRVVTKNRKKNKAYLYDYSLVGLREKQEVVNDIQNLMQQLQERNITCEYDRNESSWI